MTKDMASRWMTRRSVQLYSSTPRPPRPWNPTSSLGPRPTPLLFREELQKKYAIVCFVHEAKVEVVPSSWLIKNATVKWPTNSTSNVLMRYIRELRKPEESWDVIPVRVLGFAKTFASAHQKATVAQDTSNIGTDSSEEEVESSSRKRVRPTRFDSSTDDELQIPKNVNKKIYQIPNPPSLRDLNSSTPKSQLSQESLSASLISLPSAARSPVKGNAVYTMLNRMFKCLESIQKDVKSSKAEQAKMQLQLAALSNKEAPQKCLYMLPDGISIPVATDEQLAELNLKLKEDRDLTATFARYLHDTSLGKSLSVFLLNVTKKVLEKHVANGYSRLGRKGKKRFEAVDEVYSSILAAAAIKFPDLSREEIAEKFGRVLASSNDWDGCRNHKKLNL